MEFERAVLDRDGAGLRSAKMDRRVDPWVRKDDADRRADASVNLIRCTRELLLVTGIDAVTHQEGAALVWFHETSATHRIALLLGADSSYP